MKDIMLLREVKDLFGKKTPTIKQIAAKHKISIEILKAQLKKGIKIETEHTDDLAIANEIARDHLYEFPDYYDRLEAAEKE